MPSPRSQSSKLKKKRFKLGVKALLAPVRRSIRRAETAIEAGQAAVKRLRKRKPATKQTRDAIDKNSVEIDDTRRVLRQLKKSLRALKDTCPDQTLNSDPTIEG